MNLIKTIGEWVEKQDRISRVRQDIEMHLDFADEIRANPDMNFVRIYDDYNSSETIRAVVDINHPEGLHYFHREMADQLAYLEKHKHMRDTWLVELNPPWYVLESIIAKKTKPPRRALQGRSKQEKL